MARTPLSFGMTAYQKKIDDVSKGNVLHGSESIVSDLSGIPLLFWCYGGFRITERKDVQRPEVWRKIKYCRQS